MDLKPINSVPRFLPHGRLELRVVQLHPSDCILCLTIYHPLFMPQHCKFHATSRGCLKGNHCEFAHTGNNMRLSDAWGPTNRDTTPTSSASSHDQKLPSGTCRFFWTAGQCNHEFACRFRHDRPVEVGSRGHQSEEPGESSASAMDKIVSYLIESGSSKITDSGTDIFFSANTTNQSPPEVHNSLKRFLADDFRFKTTSDAYEFMVLINSANTTNASWVSKLLQFERFNSEHPVTRKDLRRRPSRCEFVHF